MTKIPFLAVATAFLLMTSGCGLFYTAGTEARAAHMESSLQAGQSQIDVHNKWGEPDIRTDLPTNGEVWSYAARANSNDLLASLVYTSAKEGDKGTFVDLHFQSGKLVSWNEAEHTMPSKTGTGLSVGMGGGGSSYPYGAGPGYGQGMGTGIAHF